MTLRAETRARARALQLLYAWEIQGRPPMTEIASGAVRFCGPVSLDVLDRAERLAAMVAGQVEALDRDVAEAAEHWRLERMAMVERGILRLGIYELKSGTVPPKVAIDEAVRLAHWFAGGSAPGFVNGILDRVAHALGRL